MDTDYDGHDSDSRQESGLSIVDSPSSLLTELWVFNLWWSKKDIKENKIDLIYSENEIYLCIDLCPVCFCTNVYVASWRTPLGVRQFIVQLHLCKIYEVEVQRRQWHPTPVLLPGKSHGRRSMVGCSPWGHWVGHNWATSLSLFTFMHWRRKWQPTPVFLPSESQGRGSLVGCCLWGHTESDMTEATQQQQQH